MKYLLVIICSLAFTAYSQSYPDGAVGLKYGQSYSRVLQILKNRGGTVSQGSTRELLMMTNIQYGEYAADAIFLNFHNDSLYRISIFIKPDHESETVDVYESICRNVAHKYGPSTTKVENYKYPYQKGDGHVETAITVGKATLRRYWIFEYEDVDSDMISVGITDSHNIIIAYSYGRIESKLRQQEKRKQSEDY